MFSVDDSITQALKEAFGGQVDKKNLVDPFVEAWFAGKKVVRHTAMIIHILPVFCLNYSYIFFSCVHK